MKSSIVRTIHTVFLIVCFSLQTIHGESPALTVKVGAVLPLTGPLAQVGLEVQRGLELGSQEFSTPSLQIKPIYQDTAYQRLRTISAAKKLLSDEHPDVIISLWDDADPVAALAETEHLPHIAIRWDNSLTNRYKYTLTIESTVQANTEKVLELAAAMGARTLALIGEDNQSFVLVQHILRERTKSSSIALVYDELIPSGTESRETVLRAVSKKPDLILLATFPPTTQAVIRRLREIAQHQAFTGFFENLNELDLVEGIPFVSQYALSPDFAAKYMARFHEAPISRAPHGYDIVKILASAYSSKEQRLNSDELLQSFVHLSNLSGATGLMSFLPPRTIQNQPVIKVTERGKFIEIPLTEVSRRFNQHFKK